MKTIANFFVFIIASIIVTVIFTTSVFATDITNPWYATIQIRVGASLASFSSSDKVYVVGGSAMTGNSYSDVISSTPGSDGQLSSWISEGTFPTALIFHSIVQKENNIYVLGGREENSGSATDFVNKVFLGKLSSSGNIGSWPQQTYLPNNLGMGAAAIVGNRIYFAGGYNNSLISSKVYSAPINLDGSLGGWTESRQMPEAKYGLSMVEYNGHLIVIGGDGSRFAYVGTPDANGTISEWIPTISFPTVISRASAVRVGSTLIVIGGYDGTSTTNNIYYTTIHDDGTLDAWTLSNNHLFSKVHSASAAIVGQYLYLMGGYNYPSDLYLNSVYVTKLNIGVSPTPTSTPTPTPTPASINLSVPLLKQTNSLWGNQLYDSANKWSPKASKISDWGCALTSAAMVFNYHGITKLPNGTALNPGTLNAWMKTQSDGYINGGLVNWLALSRLSKLAKPQNPTFTFDALEYRRVGGYNPLKLTQDLERNIPGILEEPGHFVVAKGTVGSTTFSINDPYYSRLLLSDYSNSFLALGEFIPSHTNLSYMMFVVDDGIVLTVKDKNGSIIGDGFTQAPLNQDGETGKSGNPKNFYYVSAPADGMYSIIVSSSSTRKYKLQSYFYNIDGNVKTSLTSGIVGKNSSDTYSISFNHVSQNASKLKKKFSSKDKEDSREIGEIEED